MDNLERIIRKYAEMVKKECENEGESNFDARTPVYVAVQ